LNVLVDWVEEPVVEQIHVSGNIILALDKIMLAFMPVM
jgi:hypothetical protein